MTGYTGRRLDVYNDVKCCTGRHDVSIDVKCCTGQRLDVCSAVVHVGGLIVDV